MDFFLSLLRTRPDASGNSTSKFTGSEIHLATSGLRHFFNFHSDRKKAEFDFKQCYQPRSARLATTSPSVTTGRIPAALVH
jgi:hypothetical protein